MATMLVNSITARITPSISIPQLKHFNSSARSLTYIENRVGEITHPCFTPFVTGNHVVHMLLILTEHLTSLYNYLIIFIWLFKKPLTPMFCNLNHKKSLFTLSKALAASTNQIYVDCFANFLPLMILCRL